MSRELVGEVVAWAGLAGVGGLVAIALYFAPPRLAGRWLPPQRQRAVSWGGIELAILVFTIMVALPGLLLQALVAAGFFQAVYGPDFPVQSLSTPDEIKNALGDPRVSLWLATLATPFDAALIVLFLGMFRSTPGYQLGLTTHRWRQNVILGYAVWLFLTPAVSIVHAVVKGAYSLWRTPEEHPLTKPFLDPAAPPLTSEWLAMLFLTFVGAPVVEELLFRGVIQAWAARRSWGGDLTIAASFIVALSSRYDNIRTGMDLGGATREGFLTLMDGLSPALFVLAMIPGYVYVERVAWRWVPVPHAARGIFGTALLFAMMHANVWPTPIPLLLFGLALGFLAFRTQSLIGPIVVHSLFDGMATITLMFVAAGQTAQPANGNAVTTAAPMPSPPAIVNFVPGASLPRRTYPSATAVLNRSEKMEDVTRPTSALSRTSFDPGAGGVVVSNLNPRNVQFTCPKSRARTIGSWPGKQPLVYEIACLVRSTSIANVFSSISTP